MRITKYLALSSTILMLASAIPFNVNAADNNADKLEYALNVDGNAVVTNVMTDKEMFTIPETVEGIQVVGVADYAFAYCENLNLVNVPDSLTNDYTFNVAFLTSGTFMKFMEGELSETASVDDIIRYIAEKANYKNGEFTDADLADASVKLEKKLKTIDISIADTLDGKVMTIIKNINNLDLNDDLKNSFNIWISLVDYNGFTLRGSDNTEMKKYAESRKFIGMNYEVVPDFVLGDANGDNKFNIRDAAYIASRLAKGIAINVRENPGADYNQDNVVNVRDAAKMASALAAASSVKK